MQIVDHCATTQIEEVLAQTPITGTPTLPSTDMRERMLNSHSLTQFVATFRRLLALA